MLTIVSGPHTSSSSSSSSSSSFSSLPVALGGCVILKSNSLQRQNKLDKHIRQTFRQLPLCLAYMVWVCEQTWTTAWCRAKVEGLIRQWLALGWGRNRESGERERERQRRHLFLFFETTALYTHTYTYYFNYRPPGVHEVTEQDCGYCCPLYHFSASNTHYTVHMAKAHVQPSSLILHCTISWRAPLAAPLPYRRSTSRIWCPFLKSLQGNKSR